VRLADALHIIAQRDGTRSRLTGIPSLQHGPGCGGKSLRLGARCPECGRVNTKVRTVHP
jgi:hypothetical protein